MELTEAQRRAAGAQASVVIEGLSGSGRTTALVARAVALLAAGLAPARLLFLVRDNDEARRVRGLIVAGLGRSLAEPPVITLTGLAALLLRTEATPPVRLLSVGEAREMVHLLLAAEGDDRWPGFSATRRAPPGFGDALANLCRDAQRRLLTAEGLAAALVAASREAWLPAASFYGRYQAAVSAAGAADPAGAVLTLLASGIPLDGRWEHVLVDDAEAAGPAAEAFVERAGPASVAVGWAQSLAGPASPMGLRRSPGAAVIPLDDAPPRDSAATAVGAAVRALAGGQRMAAGDGVDVLIAPQPREEAEAIAAALAAQARSGTPYDEMAVVGRSDLRAAVERQLTAQRIPVRRGGGETLASHWAIAPLLAALDVAGGRVRLADQLADLAQSPLGGLSEEECRDLDTLARRSGSERAECARSAMDADLGAAAPKWRRLVALVDGLSGAGLDAAVHRLWVGSPHLAEARAAALAGDPAAHAVLDVALAFSAAATDFAERRPGEGIAEFVAAARADEAPAPRRGRGVSLLGAGAVGAGRFDVVAVAGATDAAYPGGRGGRGLFDLRVLDHRSPLDSAREEVAEGRRRLLRVVSRARRRLVVTASVDTRGRARLSRLIGGPTRPVPDAALAEARAAARAVAEDARRSRTERLGAALFLRRTGVDPARWWGVHPWTNGNPIAADPLSYSAITGYATCPLQWLYERRLGFAPADSHWAEAGNLVHQLLAEVTKGVLEESRLVEEFERRFDPSRYPSRPVADHFRAVTRRSLETLLQWPKWSDNRVVAAEVDFHVTIAGAAISGRIDRIEELSPGNVRVVDYKTGRKPSERDLDELFDQVRIYLLAVRADEALSRLGKPVDGDLWYLDPEKPFRFTGSLSAEGEAAMEEKVAAVVGGVRAQRFGPTPSSAACRRCDHHHLCPAQPPGREMLA